MPVSGGRKSSGIYYLGPEVTYEWNNGILEEKGVSDYLTFQVFDWFIQLLPFEYLRTNPIANRVGLEMGFRLRLPNKVAIRRPDYGLVLHDNPAPLEGPVQSYRCFDICIEGVLTSTKAMQQRDTVVKKVEYAAGGAREYYLLHHSPSNSGIFTA